MSTNQDFPIYSGFLDLWRARKWLQHKTRKDVDFTVSEFESIYLVGQAEEISLSELYSDSIRRGRCNLLIGGFFDVLQRDFLRTLELTTAVRNWQYEEPGREEAIFLALSEEGAGDKSNEYLSAEAYGLRRDKGMNPDAIHKHREKWKPVIRSIRASVSLCRTVGITPETKDATVDMFMDESRSLRKTLSCDT